MRLTPERSEELVSAAADGDRHAWEELVEAYAGLVWSIIRNHRLSAGDASDVSQTTWLRLVESVDKIHDRSRVGAWLATTTRRECLRVLAQSRRVILVPDAEAYDSVATWEPDVDHALLAEEREEGVRQGLARLSPRRQQLLQLLMRDPAPSYDEVSAEMGIPVGSIGPTRGRCLEKLHEILIASGTAGTT